MDAAFDYCRKIVDDMEFNKKQFTSKLSIRLLAVGGQHSIPTIGEALQPYFLDVTSVVVPDAGHLVRGRATRGACEVSDSVSRSGSLVVLSRFPPVLRVLLLPCKSSLV